MKIRCIPKTRELRKKRVAAYCRVSTNLDSQEESLQIQEESYKHMIENREDWEFAGIYSDEKSATNAVSRDGFQKMILDAKEGRLDLILVKSISRFSRNIVDCQYYVRELKGCQVEVLFERENLRTFEPSSDMMFSILGAIAQDESRAISDRVRWGYRMRFARGIYNMGNNRVLGYDTVNGRLVPNRDSWMIREAFELFSIGNTYRRIADTINQKGGHRISGDRPLSESNIRVILRNEIYAGDRRLQKTAPINFLTKKPDSSIPYQSYYFPNEHEPIIERELWERVQNMLDERKENARKGIFKRSGKHHVLYGILFCGKCGAPYVRKTYYTHHADKSRDTKYKAWSCKERQKGKKGNGCRNVIVKEEEILERIKNELEWNFGETELFDEGEFLRILERVEITDGKVWVKRINR
ncbi:MAG: recombinase family protein [Bariatricus sp.]